MPTKRSLSRRADRLGASGCRHPAPKDMWADALREPDDDRRTWTHEDLRLIERARIECPHCPVPIIFMVEPAPPDVLEED